MFVVDYKEIFDDEYGHGKFFITLREREQGPVNRSPSSPASSDLAFGVLI